MAVFRVGQRVRIVRCICKEMRCHLGKEGVIIRADGRYFDIDSALDVDGIPCHWHPDHIEPIQPERNRVVAWSDCPWSPHKELA